jgi:hypothetical protein
MKLPNAVIGRVLRHVLGPSGGVSLIGVHNSWPMGEIAASSRENSPFAVIAGRQPPLPQSPRGLILPNSWTMFFDLRIDISLLPVHGRPWKIEMGTSR